MAIIKCQECGGDVSSLASACPKCGAPVTLPDVSRHDGSKNSSPVLKYGTMVIALLAGVMILTKPEKKPAASYEPAPTAAELARHRNATAGSSNLSDTLRTTIDEMVSDYDVNTVAADAKYKGRRLELTGAVSDISTDVLNNAYLIVRSNTPNHPTVRAELHESQRTLAASLLPGKSVQMVCTGAGDVLKRPQLKACILS